MNRKILPAVLVIVVLCALLIFLGLRHDAAPAQGGSSPQEENQTQQTAVQEPITATLAVCGDNYEPHPPDQRRL